MATDSARRFAPMVADSAPTAADSARRFAPTAADSAPTATDSSRHRWPPLRPDYRRLRPLLRLRLFFSFFHCKGAKPARLLRLP
ncbi:hypothetical protein GUJ93_ZPchr0008g13713 [Zizania palustris]|uniref:Uncharacterized protein n=1 Tax=Zizania palustris TaxID=103762 RepID=A0A8J5QZN8_ZIZPA|nr:hypothetical protein GUJ93_ZPchr0008g13713 [Zizania palustris]